MGSRRSRGSPRQRRLRFRDRRLTLGRLIYFIMDKGAIVIFPLALYLVFVLQVKR